MLEFRHFILVKKPSYTKLERSRTPKLELTEKIGKLVNKKDKFSIFDKLVAFAKRTEHKAIVL